MTVPAADRPLSAGDVKLLREGDVLNCPVWGVVSFLRFDDSGRRAFVRTQNGNDRLMVPAEHMTFVSRPAASDEGVGDAGLANDIAAILDENADADEDGLHNSSRLAEKIRQYLRARTSEPAGEAEPFGWWVEHKVADPVFLRPPSFIPSGPNYTRTPLYTHPALASPPVSERERELAVLLDNLVIAQSLSRELRTAATDQARSYLYSYRHPHTAQPAGEPPHG